MLPSSSGYSFQNSLTPVAPNKISYPYVSSIQDNAGFDSGQYFFKDQKVQNIETKIPATSVPQSSSATASNTYGLTYSYGQSRSNYLSGVTIGQRSYSFSRKPSNTQQQRQFFLPLKGKIQQLSRESNPTFTDLDAEINDLASIVRREREQATISRRSSSLATIPGKSNPNAFSPDHRKSSERTINLAHSLGQSITDGMEESPNYSCILTKTSSLHAHYSGSQIFGFPKNEQKMDADNLGKQVIILRNEVNVLLTKQSESNELTKRFREENDVLCVKLLNAEKTIASNKTQIDELQAQLCQARTAVQGSSQLLQNVAVLESRMKMDSNQNIELSQALLRQESKSAVCEAALNEERMKFQRKDIEFNQLVSVIESLKKDYDKMKIENISIKDDIQKEKASKSFVQIELESTKVKSFMHENENIVLKQESSKFKNEISKLISELDQQRKEQSIQKMQCDSLSNSIKDLQAEIYKLKSENACKTEENNQLKNQNSQMTIQNQGYQIELNSAKLDVTQKQQEISKLKLDLNSRNCENQRVEQNKSELDGMIKELVQFKNGNQKLLSEKESMKNQILTPKGTDIQFYIDQVHQLNAQVSDLNTSKVNLQIKIGELEKQNQTLQTQNSNLIAQQITMAQEINSMKASNTSSFNQPAKSQADLDILGRNQTVENTGNIQKQLQKQNEKCKILEKQCLILSQNATALSDKVLSLREKNKTLETKLLENANVPLEVGQRISSLLNEISFLQNKLEQSQANEGSMKETIEKFNQINNNSSFVDQSQLNSYQKQVLDYGNILSYSDTKQSYQQISDFLSAPIKPMNSQ